MYILFFYVPLSLIESQKRFTRFRLIYSNYYKETKIQEVKGKLKERIVPIIVKNSIVKGIVCFFGLYFTSLLGRLPFSPFVLKLR